MSDVLEVGNVLIGIFGEVTAEQLSGMGRCYRNCSNVQLYITIALLVKELFNLFLIITEISILSMVQFQVLVE